ncbi:MAG: DUF559 domain-containing protein [Patescibacteria group bacterium]
MKRAGKEKGNVLVCVLKSKRDRDLLLIEHWYRIPVQYAPKRMFCYVAFYQPATFGRHGKRIEYYARVKRIDRRKRRVLLPRERMRADDDYFQIHLTHISKHPRPIKNTTPCRISFGFTTLARLKSARNILELYNVAPIEEIVGEALIRASIDAIPQYQASRYRLDFAVLAPHGKIAIECDNKKAHSSSAQRKHDRKRDAFLRRHGWHVIRLREEDILLSLDSCVIRIRRHLYNVL